MAEVSIKKIKPPFIKGRIHVFRAEQHCVVSKINIYFDSNSPKKATGIVVTPGEYKYKDAKKAEKVPNVVELNKSIELDVGHRLMFMLEGSPHGIDSVDLSFTVKRYTGRNK